MFFCNFFIPLQPMDEQLLLLINGHHTEFLDSFMWLLTQKTIWIPLYCAMLYVVWRNYGWRGALQILVMIALGMLVTDWANSQFLRPVIGRLRPNNPKNPVFALLYRVNDVRGGGCGFPSAHSANNWMLTFMLYYWLRDRWTIITMSFFSLLICYSRVYLGYHYPGDILGGFVLAAITVYVITWLHSRYLHFEKVSEPKLTWMPAFFIGIIITFFALASL